MNLPKTILVPTDFSACAQEALDYALKLAARLDARVCITHALAMPVTGWEGGWAFPQEIITLLDTDAHAKLETSRLGSVTETVMRHAPCSVLAVRYPKDD